MDKRKVSTKLTDAISGTMFMIGIILTMSATSEIEPFSLSKSLLLAMVGLSFMITFSRFKVRKNIYQAIYRKL